MLRLNTLRELCDRDSILAPLREAPLVSLPGLGRFSLRDICIASGEQASTQPVGTVPDMTRIEAAFGSCDVLQLRRTLEALEGSVRDLAAIEAFVTTRVGPDHILSLEPVIDLLARMTSELKTRSGARLTISTPEGLPESRKGVDQSTTNSTAGGGMAGAQLGAGEATAGISSRADVVRALDRLCEYYERNEPSSPVPMLLRRAKRMVSMSFIDIVRELAPGGMPEVETIRGPEQTETR